MYKINKNLLCVILAGGRGKRLNGKGKYNEILLNKPLINHVYNKIKRQFFLTAVNFNKKNIETKIDAEMIYDIFNNNIGPLAGIHTALNYSNKMIGKDGFVCTVPVDTPFLPNDLAEKLYSNINKSFMGSTSSVLI